MAVATAVSPARSASSRVTQAHLVASWQRALAAAEDALQAALADHALSAPEARNLEWRLDAQRRWFARWANP